MVQLYYNNTFYYVSLNITFDNLGYTEWKCNWIAFILWKCGWAHNFSDHSAVKCVIGNDMQWFVQNSAQKGDKHIT